MVATETKQPSEIVQIVNHITEGLEAFEKRKAHLQELVKKADGLEQVKDINDKAALQIVSSIRKELKNARVEIEKEGKLMRDPLTKMGRHISSKENELVEIIEPTEKKLLAWEKWVDDEKEKIRKEKLDARINALLEFGYKIDSATLEAMPDETFAAYLKQAEEAYNNEKALKAEQEKQRLAAEEKARKDAEELEALRKKQAEQDALIAKQQEELRQAQIKSRAAELTAMGLSFNGRYSCYALDDINVDVNTEICLLNDSEWAILTDNIRAEIAERKEAAAKKQALEARTKERSQQLISLGMHFVLSKGLFSFGEIEVSQHFIETSTDEGWSESFADVNARVVKAVKENERQRVEALENAKREAAEKALQEQRDNDERKRLAEAERLAAASDVEKWKNLIGQIQAIKVPEMKSLKSRKRADEVTDMLNRLVDHIQVGLK